jgi:hypothetical protein
MTEQANTGKSNGCKKTGKKRKSSQNARYVAEKRADIHKAKRIAKHAKAVSTKAAGIKVRRGTARANRRGG